MRKKLNTILLFILFFVLITGRAIAALDAAIISHTIPASVYSGDVFQVSVTLQNTSTEGESFRRPLYWFISRTDPINLWGPTLVGMLASDDIQPGMNKTFEMTFTAPVTPGTYPCEWQILYLLSGYFGEQLALTIEVVACNMDGECDDGLYCNGAETCTVGTCQSGTPVDCDDGIACTDDSCDENTDTCINFPNDLNCLDDGLFCNGNEYCDAIIDCSSSGNPCPETECNTCQESTDSCFDPAGTACTDDANPCTDDTCDGAGTCIHANNTDSCDDGDACTENDICSGGSCTGGTPVVCNDSNICTDDSCNPASGCVYINSTAACDDGNACTEGDICSGGSCTGGTPIVCNDSNICTDDSCNPASGCVYTNNSDPCDDGDACTENDTCSSGSCQPGTAIVCDDSNICTDDACNPASGCVYTNNNDPCDDGIFCNGSDTCSDGNCTHAGDPCSSGTVCNEATDNCDLIADCGNGIVDPGEDCDPPGDCCAGDCTYETGGTVCRAAEGVCDVAETCSGFSATCPDDGFSSGTICRPSAGACDIAEYCSGSEALCPDDYQIEHSVSLSPDPLALGSPGAQGILTATVTEGMVEAEGVEVFFSEGSDPGYAIELLSMAKLDDSGEATVAIHGLGTGTGELTLTAVDENGSEIPGAICTPDTPDDACADLTGTTLEITSLPCDTVMSASCTVGVDPAAGYLVAGIAPLTVAEVAAEAVTDTAGEAKVLVKAAAEGTATVEASVTCGITIAEATCSVGQCENDDDCIFLDDQCTVGVCNPATNICEKDPAPKEGLPCDDGLFCNGSDACSGGSCTHTGDPCSGGTVCNEETDSCDLIADCGNGIVEPGEDCDPPGDCCAGDCTYELQGTSCSDGLFCNGAETCDDAGTCQPGTPVDCPDDGLFCNGTESCNEITDSCSSSGNPCPGGTICNESHDTCTSASTTTTTISVTTTTTPPTSTTTTPTTLCSVVISPDTQTVESGEAVEFTAVTSCDGVEVEGAYVWEIMPASTIGSGINEGTGLYTAGNNNTASDMIEIIQVTDVAYNTTDTAEAVISRIEPVCETVISPSAATIDSEESITFTASTGGTGCLEPDYAWQIETDLNSQISASGASCFYQAGTNETQMLHTDTLTVVDRANGTSAEVVVTVYYGRIKRVFPRLLFGSRWIPLAHIMYIIGEDTGFNRSSQPVFTPGDSITTIGKIGFRNFMAVLLLVSPNPEQELIDLAVPMINEAGQDVTFSREDAFSIRLLPFALDEQENKPK